MIPRITTIRHTPARSAERAAAGMPSSGRSGPAPGSAVPAGAGPVCRGAPVPVVPPLPPGPGAWLLPGGGSRASTGWVRMTRPQVTVTSRPSRPTREKWTSGVRCGAASPPRAEPARPPKDHAAWKDGMTGRRSTATRSTARLFMATLRPP